MSIIKKATRELQDGINSSIHDFADCSICGYCCKDEALDITVPDANRISKFLKIDKKIFYDKYTNINQITKMISMNMPCPFLIENRCSIYSFRPEKCKNYPVFVLEDGFVRIAEIEACALATHFNEAFLEFLSKYYPECYKIAVKNDDECKVEPGKIRNADYNWKYMFYFINWLNSNKD